MELCDELMAFGLSRQEATLYLCLLADGDLNGYELAKKTGISRSNAYTGLAGLVDKGAAWLLQGETQRYRAVPGEEFTAACLRRWQELREELLPRLPRPRPSPGHYVTVSGATAIRDRLHQLLAQAESRVYLAMPHEILALALPSLKPLAARGCRLTIITDRQGKALAQGSLPQATVHLGQTPAGQIRLITDSRQVLTGETGPGSAESCLYSDHANLVALFKSALKNEIRLAALDAAEPHHPEAKP